MSVTPSSTILPARIPNNSKSHDDHALDIIAPSSSALFNVDEWKEDEDADRRSRQVIKQRILDPGEYTDDETKCFDIGLKMERLVTPKSYEKQQLERFMPNTKSNNAEKLTTTRVAPLFHEGDHDLQDDRFRVKKIRTKHSLLQASTIFRDNILHGKVTCIVRAPSIDVLSFLMDNDSQIFSKYERGSMTKERKTLEVPNNHRAVIYASYSTAFADREFVGNVIWRAENENEYLVVNIPTDHALAPISSYIVRAETIRTIRLIKVSPGVTKFTLTFTMNLKGSIPSWLTNNFVIPAILQGPALYQNYFMLIKPASEFDKGGEDATMLAQLLLDEIFSQPTAARREETLQKYFNRAASLRSVSLKYPWFQELMKHIMHNKVRPSSTCLSSLSSFTFDDAKAVGRSLPQYLLSSTTPEMAVDDWLLSYPSMRELSSDVELFIPFVTCVAKCLLNQSNFGTKFRVISGAVISVMDMFTDINMIYQFYQTGHDSAANATILMISLSLIIQLFFVYIQNSRNSRLFIAREMLIVLSCLKPGYDAYLVLQGGEKDPLANIDPMLSMIFTKFIEVAFESIGGTILQTSILLNSRSYSALSIVSLSTSILSISYAATTAAYDMDTSPENRRRSPNVWGFVPDQGRGLVFFLMMMLAVLQVVAKIFSIALIISTNSIWLIIWMSSEILLYLIYKAARRDFIYYLRGLSGWPMYISSFVVRVVCKLLTDVTGFLILRNPYELGGSYFAFNLANSQASCWVAATLYINYVNGDIRFDNVTIYTFFGALQLFWVLTVILFFSKINRKYWLTFFSTQTGRQCTVARFLDSQDDAMKMYIFASNEHLWSDIKDVVKAYTLSNWERWDTEKPSWFDENFRASVADEFIPQVALTELNRKSVGGKRRRSSVGVLFASDDDGRGHVVESKEYIIDESATIAPSQCTN